MLISCIKVIKEANNMMISHDDYFHCFYSLITYCITIVIFFLITFSHYACNYFGRGAVTFSNGVHLRLEIRLLIFAWFPSLHREVVTNLICPLPQSVATSSTPTIFLWWMASRWNTGSSEGITNVTRFNHMTNGPHFNTLRCIPFKPYKHNILSQFCIFVEILSCFKLWLKLNCMLISCYSIKICSKKQNKKKKQKNLFFFFMFGSNRSAQAYTASRQHTLPHTACSHLLPPTQLLPTFKIAASQC